MACPQAYDGYYNNQRSHLLHKRIRLLCGPVSQTSHPDRVRTDGVRGDPEVRWKPILSSRTLACKPLGI